jgi:hypothetical protein
MIRTATEWITFAEDMNVKATSGFSLWQAAPPAWLGDPKTAGILQEGDLAMTLRSRAASRLIEVGSLPEERMSWLLAESRAASLQSARPPLDS